MLSELSTVKGIELARAEQTLKQEQATFDQRKKLEYCWSILRLAMGYTALALFPTMIAVSFYIIAHHDSFGAHAVTLAAAALFGNVLGLILTVWKIVLNPTFVTKLEPITKAGAAKRA